MPDARENRSLIRLMESASSARVMNLANRPEAARQATTPEMTLFRTEALDRAILVKHRLRLHEQECFLAPRAVATKILIPIDPDDISVGAHSVMVGERGFEQMAAQQFGLALDSPAGVHDLGVLAALDQLPSFDPFLTREHLRRSNFTVNPDYFDISAPDVERMMNFARGEIVPLVQLCFGESADTTKAERLTQKVLAAELDASLEPLRLTFKMTEDQFVEGIFCWKGFLYYKWSLFEILSQATVVLAEIQKVKFRGKATPDEQVFIRAARTRIASKIKQACREIRGRLGAYDEAFAALTQKADPAAFRDFLLAAPYMFVEVGERLGALQHIASFWQYRFGKSASAPTAAEVFDLFVEYDNSLGCVESSGRQHDAAESESVAA